MRLVYLSPVPWASFAQRPHRFVEWFHGKCGGKVLWIDPYPTRLPVFADFKRTKESGCISAKAKSGINKPAWLSVVRPNSLPIEPLPGAGAVNWILWKDVLKTMDAFIDEGECLLGIGKPSEFALQVLSRHPAVPSLYDAMDNFPAFYQGLSRARMARRERLISDRVSHILVSSSALAERFVHYRPKITLALNACAVDILPPVDSMSSLKPGKTVLGYIGTIGPWFDWSLVFVLAEANPLMCIRLIGPRFTAPPGAMPPNIDLMPACDHATAIRLMEEFSVGLIPFKRTDLTASIDPIKYYEYRALGLPVLSTCFGEMALREGKTGVFLVDEYSDTPKQLKAAMAYAFAIDDIQEFRTANSWKMRFDASRIMP